MDKVVFLDRDGTINEEVHYLHRPEDLRILPGVAEGIARLRRAGFRIVVVTNQAGVARGYYGPEDVEQLHACMNRQLEAAGAKIDEFYYCPHHPEHGIGAYKTACRCRKPGTGMFEMAQKKAPVDKSRSYMIGDRELDMKAGRNFGVGCVLVGTGYGAEEMEQAKREGREPFYDYYAENFAQAADYILRREENRTERETKTIESDKT